MALRWFRFGRRKKEDEAAASSGEGSDAAPTEASVVAPPEADAPTAEEESEKPKKRRRRGSRGGRGRKRATAGLPAGEQPEERVTGEEVEVAPPARSERRADRASSRRRRTPTRRAPLPEAKRELLISVDVGEQRVAILEDDRVAEVYLERPERRSIAGNIYLGVVDNVLPGMEAAFVEIGLEKNGFLYVDEIVGPELEGRRGARKIQDLIRRGETILVQAVKDPMKSKGARLTTEISLPGRYLVYVPNGEGSGVSRRLDEEERARLKEILAGLDAKGGGIIVRTAAEGASAEDIERDLVFLQRLWRTIQAKAKTVSAPALVYQEAELPLRIVRDLFTGDFVAARIDDDRTFRRIVGYLKKTSPHMVERVHRYREKEPLFQVYGVDREIASTLERRVDLPSGGYLVFDYAEAFTVIDVNTGRFVGSRAKGATGRLEDTIVKNNLEAVREVVRQLRLRDIGGIIVIDFIDMANPKNRQTVEEALRTELERDRTKTYVVEISPLGLVEMTRQNVTEGPREILTAKCAACGGDGFVVSDATHALTVERKLKALAKGSRVQAFQVAVHPRVLPILAGPAGARLEAIERSTRRRFFLVPARDANAPLDTVEVLAQGKVDALRPEAPVEEGATIDLRLVEVGLHDKAAAVGKLDGTEVVVAGAAKLVGRKVQVRVGRVLEGIAFASLVEEWERPVPVTFEAEAEKPTRAPARRRLEVEAVAAEPPEETVPETGVDETTLPLETVPAGEGGGLAAEAAPRRKRTRRGSRGGRGRRKSAETTEQVALADERPEVSARPTEEAGALSEPENGRPRAPRIHLPPPDVGREPVLTLASAEGVSIESTGDEETGAEVLEGALDGQPKRKRTRRGTRGGRRRRKAPAASDGVPPEVAEDPGTPGEPEVASVARAAIETATDHAG